MYIVHWLNRKGMSKAVTVMHPGLMEGEFDAPPWFGKKVFVKSSDAPPWFIERFICQK